MIEKARLGGTCVNVGCVPKKVMFNAASVIEAVHAAKHYGVSVGEVKVDWAAIKAKRDAYVARLNGIYGRNLASSGVTSITGEATFVGPRRVRVGEDEYTVREQRALHLLI